MLGKIYYLIIIISIYIRYASRAKNIKNQPKVNEDPKGNFYFKKFINNNKCILLYGNKTKKTDAMLREYADEIKKLKELLIRQ